MRPKQPTSALVNLAIALLLLALTALNLAVLNRIRTIQGSLAIEGNTLSESQITAVLDAITPSQVKQLLEILKGKMGRDDIQQALGLRDRKSFRERDLRPALIEMTIPDKSNSRLQRYRKKGYIT